MNPGCDKLPLWERRQVHEEPRTDQVVRTATAFGTSTMETVAARWTGAPGVGDAELGLTGSRRLGEQDRRGRGTG